MQRNTRQREAIRQVFRTHARPLAPEEVLTYAQKEVPRLGMATVYRNLAALRDENWLVAVNIPQRGVLYERSGKDHHHHFYCRKCRKLLDFPGCPLGKRHLAPRGYVLESHELFLYGVCKTCASNGRRRRSRA
jgi:Fur family ferric uptake transcriptional regulator